MRNNCDLQEKAAAIISAQGSYQVQHAVLFPPITVTGQANYNAPSDLAGFSFAPTTGTNASLLRYYGAGIGFSAYEVDLFGRIRNLSKFQAESVLAAAENTRSVRITLISQIANTYLQWLSDRALLHIAQDTLSSQQQTLELTKNLFTYGQTEELTLSQIQTQVESAASDVARFTRQMAVDEHALQMLGVGTPLPDTPPSPSDIGQQTLMADIPAGLPSELIANRPDVRALEHQLIGANTSIGAARAVFFPKVTLTSQEGISSLQFRNLFTPNTQTWGANPSITLLIFTWGQNAGNLKMAKAEQRRQVALYEKGVQKAFQEVSGTLTGRETYLRQDQHLTRLIAASRKAYDLAMMRYKSGIDPYLTTLTQQRTLYLAQQNLIMAQLARYQNIVTLYRALGGGWSEKDVQLPSSAHAQKGV
ncbi:MAG: efflux transporter outer membrane subunit [Acetobacteraceae bacterium]